MLKDIYFKVGDEEYYKGYDDGSVDTMDCMIKAFPNKEIYIKMKEEVNKLKLEEREKWTQIAGCVDKEMSAYKKHFSSTTKRKKRF